MKPKFAPKFLHISIAREIGRYTLSIIVEQASRALVRVCTCDWAGIVLVAGASPSDRCVRFGARGHAGAPWAPGLRLGRDVLYPGCGPGTRRPGLSAGNSLGTSPASVDEQKVHDSNGC